MGGLAFGLVLVSAMFGFLWVTRQMTSTAYMVTLVAVLVAIPADAIIGRLLLSRACDAAKKITVLRQVEGVQGVRLTYTTILEDSVRAYGYKLMESRYPASSFVTRAVVGPDKKVIYGTTETTAVAPYEVRLEEREGFFLSHRSYIVSPSGSPEVLGEAHWASFRGGWAERFMRAFSDAGTSGYAATCTFTTEYEQARKLIRATLVPAPYQGV